jgi:hypothetical protein
MAKKVLAKRPVATATAPKAALEPVIAKAAAPVVIEPVAVESVPAEPVFVGAAPVEAVPAPVVEVDTVSIPPVSKEGIVKMTDTVKNEAFEAAEKVAETVKAQVAEAGEKATAFAKDFQVKAKEAFGKAGESAKTVVEFHKANLEAVVESGKIAAKAAQDQAQTAVELGRKNWEANTAHFKALTGVKSPTDFFKMQADFARKQLDAVVSDVAKSNEATMKLAGEIVAPLQNRYSVVADQLKARFAA